MEYYGYSLIGIRKARVEHARLTASNNMEMINIKEIKKEVQAQELSRSPSPSLEAMTAGPSISSSSSSSSS